MSFNRKAPIPNHSLLVASECFPVASLFSGLLLINCIASLLHISKLINFEIIFIHQILFLSISSALIAGVDARKRKLEFNASLPVPRHKIFLIRFSVSCIPLCISILLCHGYITGHFEQQFFGLIESNINQAGYFHYWTVLFISTSFLSFAYASLAQSSLGVYLTPLLTLFHCFPITYVISIKQDPLSVLYILVFSLLLLGTAYLTYQKRAMLELNLQTIIKLNVCSLIGLYGLFITICFAIFRAEVI